MKHHIEKPNAPKPDDYMPPTTWQQEVKDILVAVAWAPLGLACILFLCSLPALLIGLILYVITGGRARMW
jgi:hypothetical protein